jgi:hypothetical protein
VQQQRVGLGSEEVGGRRFPGPYGDDAAQPHS